MKYSISATRTKILLWLVVITNIFFSYTVFNLSSILFLHTIYLGKIGLPTLLMNAFVLFAPVFLLWAFYQNKKQNNLFKACFTLSIILIVVRLISIALAFNLLAFIYVLLYIDFGMYFKSKIAKTV